MGQIELLAAGSVLVPAVVSIPPSATPSIDVDVTDVAEITGLATAITSFTTNLTGAAVDAQKLLVRITDNGVSQTIAWGASFKSSGNAVLPTATPAGKRLTVGLIYDSAATSWVCMAADSGY